MRSSKSYQKIFAERKFNRQQVNETSMNQDKEIKLFKITNEEIKVLLKDTST